MNLIHRVAWPLPSRPPWPPRYWAVRASFEIPTPRAGCPRDHGLRLRRARRHHREWEQAIGVMLFEVEAITRFPAYCIGDRISYWNARPITMQTYGFDQQTVLRVGQFLQACFPGAQIQTGEYDESWCQALRLPPP